MTKIKKKGSLTDLKDQLEKKADTVATEIEKKSEVVAKEVVEVVDTVTKDKKLKSLFKKIHLGRFTTIVLVIIAVGGIGASGYFFYQYNKAQQVLGSSQNQINELKSIVEEVGKLMDLPPEEPTVATVSDIEKLKTQPFFARAQNGDKVLIFQSTRKAILYRQSIKKIIDVATVNMGDPAVNKITQNPSVSVTPTPLEDKISKIVIWNGTTTTGLTKIAEEKLKSVAKAEVIERDNAKEKNYNKNIVINLAKVPDATINEIAGIFDADVMELPSGEDAPKEGDILIILGSSFAPSVE